MKAKELAKKLGVSPATISLVLNNRPGISDSLRRSLLEKIEEMGCQDMMCESCKNKEAPKKAEGNGSCPVIAYLIYSQCGEEDSNSPFSFFPAVMEGAEMEARDNGWCLSVLHSNRSRKSSLSSLIRRTGNVAGVIVQASQMDEQVLRDMESLEIPFVFVDAYRPDLRYSGVCVNNEQGIFSLVKYLKERGHTQIGYVYSKDGSQSLRERLRCFHSALREFGLEDKPENYFAASWDSGAGCYNYLRLVEQFRQAERLPTALVAEDDGEAAHIFQALRQLGLRVPEDVSVVGFDDSFLASMVDPPLTTVKNYRHLMGRECVMMLENLLKLKKLGMQNACLKYEISTKLVERGSVRDLTREEKAED